MMKLTTFGTPLAKQRHRCACVGRRRNIPVAIDVQGSALKKVKFQIKNAFQKLLKKEEAIDLTQVDSFRVDLTFLFPVPKSDSTVKRNGKLWGFENYNLKPDNDNLEKLHFDCMNKQLFSDDSQIVYNQSKKFYSEIPRTEIEIVAIKGVKVCSDAEAVLRNISPSELKEFLKDVGEFLAFPVQKVDELLPEAETPFKEADLTRIAQLLSNFAMKHSDKLNKIKKCRTI